MIRHVKREKLIEEENKKNCNRAKQNKIIRKRKK